MAEQSAKMTYRLSDGTETTYLVELQPESDYSMMDKKFYLAGVEAEQERIIKLLMDRAFWLVHLDRLIEAEELKLQAAIIKGENNG